MLLDFYTRTRPWGWWGPIRDAAIRRDPSFEPNRDFLRDAFNVVVGIIWQTAFVALPIYVVIQDWRPAGICAGDHRRHVDDPQVQLVRPARNHVTSVAVPHDQRLTAIPKNHSPSANRISSISANAQSRAPSPACSPCRSCATGSASASLLPRPPGDGRGEGSLFAVATQASSNRSCRIAIYGRCFVCHCAT